MDAGHGDGDRAARETQVLQLIDAVRSDSADRAVVIAGDFNMSGRDAGDAALTEKLLAETGTREVSRVLGRYDGRIDRILVRDGPGVRLVALDWRVEAEAFTGPDGLPLSDHSPVSASFRVERP
jgi:endonuclease/exonuclease/phosphatase family metal-dependent hydrolase